MTLGMQNDLQGYWLPRTYPNRVPSTNIEELDPFRDVIQTTVSRAINKRFRIIHYNAGASTYHQLIRFGLDHSARASLLLRMQPDADIAREIKTLKPEKETIWNSFTPAELVNTIIKASFSHPEWNPFYRSLVIVDESHNFISQNMTKLGNLMYSLRMSTPDCRTLLLSGTPIMNHPIEALYLFDYLRGPSTTYYVDTEQNPSEPWKPGIVHSPAQLGDRRRIKLTVPLMGWSEQSDGTMTKDPSVSFHELQSYFGRMTPEGNRIRASKGEMVSSSRHNIVWGMNEDSK